MTHSFEQQIKKQLAKINHKGRPLSYEDYVIMRLGDARRMLALCNEIFKLDSIGPDDPRYDQVAIILDAINVPWVAERDHIVEELNFLASSLSDDIANFDRVSHINAIINRIRTANHAEFENEKQGAYNLLDG